MRIAFMWERMALIAAAVLLIKPGLLTDLAGGVLLLAVLASQLLFRGKTKSA